ncbi:MAG: Uma2 family endonuclease [Chloroflexi bacterium]|nr:Uma2 family endonuclease [Chloroflexota bacterium]
MQAPTTRRFTVDEYYRMADAGILGEHDRVELINGEIVQMPAMRSRHAACIVRLNRRLTPLTVGLAEVRVQLPVRVDEYSEPEPDVALAQPRADAYVSAHPTPAEIFLVIEVADSSVRYDRTVKARLYAAAGIPEYWLVDLQAERVHAFKNPGPTGYGAVGVHRRGDLLAPDALPSISLSIEEILG